MSKNRKVTWLVVAIIIVAIIGVGGWFVYNKYFATAAIVQIDENQTEAEVKKGQEFKITLGSNQTTGFNWTVSNIFDKNIVKIISDKYIAPGSTAMGASGEQEFTFKGVGSGKVNIVFTYARSFERDPSQEAVKTYSITVK